jgi:CubicO group peptidase (beta-lactamase class C family)
VSSLPRSTPEAQGISTAALDAFVAALDASDQEIHTLMVVRHGHVVLEEEWSPYRLADRHQLFSVSKSFTSMAVGLAIEAGLLSVDDKVVSFFDGDDLPEKIGDNLAAMEVRHLLTMSTGHADDTVERIGRDSEGDGRMVRAFLSLEVEHEPGAPFVYNTGATYILSAIVQKVTGEKLLDYLRPRLLEPLGATEAIWETSAEGIDVGGWGLSINTASLADFSQFLLQRGSWEGRQLVPADWIDVATSKQVSNADRDSVDWQQGYGYQFWRAQHNTYRGDGAFGQYCMVLPDLDTTVSITSASKDMQATMNVIWDHLLPALQGAEVEAVPRPGRLEILPPTGPAPQPGDGRTYQFDGNPSGLSAVRLDPDGTGTFTFEGNRPGTSGTQDVVAAPGDWHEVAYVLPDPAERMVTSAYGDGDAFVATVRLLETPFVLTLVCRPTGGKLTVVATWNVMFGPAEFIEVSR